MYSESCVGIEDLFGYVKSVWDFLVPEDPSFQLAELVTLQTANFLIFFLICET